MLTDGTTAVVAIIQDSKIYVGNGEYRVLIYTFLVTYIAPRSISSQCIERELTFPHCESIFFFVSGGFAGHFSEAWRQGEGHV